MIKKIDVKSNRESGIGGSDAAAAIGVSPYKTPVGLWLEKTGRVDPPDLTGNAPVEWGTLLEDTVAHYYSERTGKKLRRDNYARINPTHEFMFGHIDRKIVGENAGLEVKTAGAFSAKEWGNGVDTIPEFYLCQIHHYIAVFGFDYMDAAVLIGGRDFRIYHVERDQEMEDLLIEKEAIFWGHVANDSPPPPKTIEDAEFLYPYQPNTIVHASPEISAEVRLLRDIQIKIKELSKTESTLKENIKMYMAENESLIDDSGILATYKTQTANRFNQTDFKKSHPDLMKKFMKSSESRVFRLKGEK